MTKRKILFLPAGLGLAHVGRSSVLAKELQQRGYDIYFGVGEHGSVVLDKEGLPYSTIPEVTWEVYEEKFRRMRPSIFSREMIEDFVARELKLYKDYRPDAIVADARPTAKISAKVAKLPLITLANVDATPYYDFSQAKIRFPSYWAQFLPQKMVGVLNKKQSKKIMKKIAPYFLRAVTSDQLLKFNYVLLSYNNEREIFTHFLETIVGDVTLLLDIPEYRPVKELPENVKLVGPIFWDGVKTLPSWADKVRPDKKTIYVTTSGTGDKRILHKVIDYLSNEAYQVIITVGNTCELREIRLPNRDDFFATRFLPGGWAMQRASLLIYHGGSATSYQALTYGVPQVGIPVNLDQEDSVNQLERLGTAIHIDPYRELNKDNLVAGVQKVITTPSYARRATQLASKIKGYNSLTKAANIIEEKLR